MDAFFGTKEKGFNWWFDKFAISKCKVEREKIWRKTIIPFSINSNKRIGDRKKRRKNFEKRKAKYGKRKIFKGKRINYLRKRKLFESKRTRAKEKRKWTWG